MSEYVSTVLQSYKQMTDIYDVGAILISMVIHVIQFFAFQFHVTTDIARTAQISTWLRNLRHFIQSPNIATATWSKIMRSYF